MLEHFILEGHTVVPVDLMTWARWFEKADRHVGDDVVGDFRVSTVFLGLDHSFGGPTPLLFETMIFRVGSSSDLFCARYSTWDEAVAGHARAIELARSPENFDAVGQRSEDPT